MGYDVIVSPTAEDDLKKFDKEMQRRFHNKLEKLKEYPDIHGKPLKWPLAGKWELYFERRWRIVYEIREDEKLVKVVAVLHKDDF